MVPGEILFLRNDDAFDLALAPGDVADLPSWFHFGFRLALRKDVCDLHRRMAAAGVGVRELLDEDDLASFRCSDPDGYSIEVYWE